MGKRLPHCPGQKLIDRIPTTTQTPTALHPTPPQALALQIKKNRKRSRVRERRGGEEKKKRAVSPCPFSSGFLCAFDLPRTIYHRSEEKGKRKKKKVPRYVNRQAITKDVRTSCPLDEPPSPPPPPPIPPIPTSVWAGAVQ